MTGAARSPRSMVLRVAAGVSLLAFLGYYTPPAKPKFQLCGFHWLTGRPCPLCGLTHAMLNLSPLSVSATITFVEKSIPI